MKRYKQTRFLFNLFLLAGLISTTASVEANDDLHIRTIASSCYACHGTHGNPAESDFSIKHKTLAGMSVEKFEEKMQGFRDGTAESTVMYHHVESLRPEEIKGLAVYFSQQTVKKSTLPPQQQLEASHD